jgi:penicillin amidase
MRAAFATAVSQLSATFRGTPSGWRLDGLAGQPVVYSAQVPVLGYGSRAAATSPWLGDEHLSAYAGVSMPAGQLGTGWRMIVRLSPRPAAIVAEGIYPGGQSDNPASAWHDNLTARWQNGGYFVLPAAGTPVMGRMRWEFLP